MIQTARSIALLLALAALAIAGCTTPQSPAETGARPGNSGGAAARRFSDTPQDNRTAVESAIELSEKYAKLSDLNVTLRQENQRLASDNESLQQQVTTLDARLKQTQKELTEANDLLIEMLTELNTWKTNILGFRGEMRDAARAQLEALLKVLEILGGEAEAGVLGQRHADTLNQDTNDVGRADGSALSQGSEPNGIQ